MVKFFENKVEILQGQSDSFRLRVCVEMIEVEHLVYIKLHYYVLSIKNFFFSFGVLLISFKITC